MYIHTYRQTDISLLVWCYMPVIPALRSPRWEDDTLQASLDYTARQDLSQKTQIKPTKKVRHI